MITNIPFFALKLFFQLPGVLPRWVNKFVPQWFYRREAISSASIQSIVNALAALMSRTFEVFFLLTCAQHPCWSQHISLVLACPGTARLLPVSIWHSVLLTPSTKCCPHFSFYQQHRTQKLLASFFIFFSQRTLLDWQQCFQPCLPHPDSLNPYFFKVPFFLKVPFSLFLPEKTLNWSWIKNWDIFFILY